MGDIRYAVYNRGYLKTKTGAKIKQCYFDRRYTI